MLLRITLSVWMLLFSFYGAEGLVQAKTSKEVSKPITKPWAKLDGFRSAKFGMDQKRVMRAIAKDFKISKSKVKLNVHTTEKTTNLSITVPKLLGGGATIAYILGQKSKELVQVNVVWGLGVEKNVDESSSVVSTANMLRDYFLKKRYKKESLIVNAKLSNTQMVVFRGKDKKDRMVLAVLTKQKKKGSAIEAANKISLRLSYMLNFDEPDVFSIKEGEF